MTRILSFTLACLSVSLAAAAQPLDARRTDVAVGASFAQGGPSPIRLTVQDAIARGFDTSHRLAEARAREEGAQAAVKGAEAAKLPIVNANLGYTRTNHVPIFGFPTPTGFVIAYPDIPNNVVSRVQFQWPIFTSGRADALERAIQADASAAVADIDTARADLKFEIVRAYWAAVTAREAVRVLEESAARAEAELTDARQRFKVGLIPPNEVSSLEAQRSRELAQFYEARNIRESALIDLRRLIGLPHDAVVELADALEAPSTALQGEVSSLVHQALESRPERRALSFRLDGLQERQHAASRANLPTINLAGGVDYARPNSKIFPRKPEWQETWDLGVTINWNFVDFGRTKAQVAEVEAAAKATRERLAEFDTVVTADVRQRLLDLDSAQAQVKAATDAVTSATEARRVVGNRFAAGVATSTDVLVAQVAMLEVELVRTRALASVRLAEARLERVLGR